jgi:hypothetical protein
MLFFPSFNVSWFVRALDQARGSGQASGAGRLRVNGATPAERRTMSWSMDSRPGPANAIHASNTA